ncbi:MAG: FAD binding domain-containing protein [Anaerolineales bacterium]
MISDYHRPQTLEEALKLLSEPDSRPLGGGTFLTLSDYESFSVVDLQFLGLDKLRKSTNTLNIGATVTLQALLESPHTPLQLKSGLNLEAPLNQRNRRTVAGALITSTGRSPFAIIMMALDAKLRMEGRESIVHPLGDFLLSRSEFLKNKLITNIEIPLQLKLAFETVARSPVDKLIVCAALAQWKSGRTRLVLGGWGKTPTLAFDGTDSTGIETAARNAAQAANDEWASAEYRSNVAAVLSKRCLDSVSKENVD